MSSSSTTKTKFKSAVTVVTSDFANTIYGGKKGSSEETAITSSSVYGQYDPRLGGHLHDGVNADGHASKINLDGGAHIRGKLPHANLGDQAVHKVNVYNNTTETDSEIIPWRTFDGTNYSYYLNLSDYTSYLSTIMTLDGVATNGNKTDQKIMLGSDSIAPTAQLDVISGSLVENVRLRTSISGTSYSGYLNQSEHFHLYSKEDSYSGIDSNFLKIHSVKSTPPSVGIDISADQGAIEINANNLTNGRISSFAAKDNVLKSNDNSGGTGVLIKTEQNSTIDIISKRSSGSNPGIVMETESGSAIHIGSQSIGFTNTSEVRAVAADITFYTFGRKKTLTASSMFVSGNDYRKRAEFNADGHLTLGNPDRGFQRSWYPAGNPKIRNNGTRSFNMQSETKIDSVGVGEDNVLLFDSVYYQNAASAPATVQDHTYIKIETPDFVNDNQAGTATGNVPTHNTDFVTHYTSYPQSGLPSPSNPTPQFETARSSVFRFVHPLNDGTTAPPTGKEETIDTHNCLVTNMSQTGHPMNQITPAPTFGGATQAGYDYNVVAWMKVLVDRWDGSAWVKELMYVPLCMRGKPGAPKNKP